MRLLLQRPKGRPLRTARGQGTKDVMIRFREVILLLALLFLAGCAAGPNAVANTPGENGTVAGFWLGLWHGWVCPINFVLSPFPDSVHFFYGYNNRRWGRFWFLLRAAARRWVVGSAS